MPLPSCAPLLCLPCRFVPALPMPPPAPPPHPCYRPPCPLPASLRQTYGVRLEVPERTNEVTGRYAAAAEALAGELGVPCLNLWRAFQARAGEGARLGGGRCLLSAENEGSLRASLVLAALSSAGCMAAHSAVRPSSLATQEVPGWQQGLLCDGLHLTPEGNNQVYRLLQASRCACLGGAAFCEGTPVRCPLLVPCSRCCAVLRCAAGCAGAPESGTLAVLRCCRR